MLNMMYRPAEIADEIGVTTDTIYRSYLPAGLPHTRDEVGEIWIHGLTFTKWATETIVKKKSKRYGLADGHGWCFKCNVSVLLIDPEVKPVNYFLEMLQAKCPRCGTLVSRARGTRKAGVQ
jgi:hypothetical protein